MVEEISHVSIQIENTNIRGIVSTNNQKFLGTLSACSIKDPYRLGEDIARAIPLEMPIIDTITLKVSEVPDLVADRQLIAACIHQRIRYKRLVFENSFAPETEIVPILSNEIRPHIWSLLYLHKTQDLIGKALETQIDAITMSIEVMADTLARGGLIHTFGTGHSHLLAEELFYRAGGLAAIYPILDERLMLHKNVVAGSLYERTPGLANEILDKHPIENGDVVIVISNSGGNQVSIELVKQMKSLGVKVIALTSLNHSKSSVARSKSMARIGDLADIVLDNSGVVGDALVHIANAKVAVGPTSTVVGSALLQAIIVGVVANLMSRGLEPEIFLSSNVDKGDEVNLSIIEKYRKLISLY